MKHTFRHKVLCPLSFCDRAVEPVLEHAPAVVGYKKTQTLDGTDVRSFLRFFFLRTISRQKHGIVTKQCIMSEISRGDPPYYPLFVAKTIRLARTLYVLSCGGGSELFLAKEGISNFVQFHFVHVDSSLSFVHVDSSRCFPCYFVSKVKHGYEIVYET